MAVGNKSCEVSFQMEIYKNIHEIDYLLIKGHTQNVWKVYENGLIHFNKLTFEVNPFCLSLVGALLNNVFS